MSVQNRLRASGVAALLLPLAGCATMSVPATPAASVQARAETDPVGTTDADAADDPAIWYNRAEPGASLIVATDKRAGLHVYNLSGRERHAIEAGRVNNVDLRDGVAIAGQPGVLVAASDRSDPANAMIALFRLDTASARLVPLGRVAAGLGEAYGMCLARIDNGIHAFVVTKEGSIAQVALDVSAPVPAGRIVRTLKLATQSEGCVVDERTTSLYVGEEDVGIWRFDAAPDGATEPVPFARVDGRTLVADVEGLAIAAEGERSGHLVASSQGDNAFTLYRLEDGALAGRFRVVDGVVGGTSETDGIEVMLADFGPAFPGGLMVAQDGDNRPAAQNFKLVAWADVLAALKQLAAEVR